jgi:diaminobutyrate-2-oxoglutarate transaminase
MTLNPLDLTSSSDKHTAAVDPATALRPDFTDAAPHSPYLERQARRESNARTYPRGLPIVIRSGRGAWVKDVDGRTYIDCLAGAGALALGHNHPEVVAALRRALDDEAPMQTLDLPTPLKDRFTEELFASLPAEFASDYKIQFCGPSGSDAVEAALKLVKTATGKRGILAFQGAYHGMTLGSLSVSSDSGPRRAIAGLSSETHFLPFPLDKDCPFGLGGAAGAAMGVRYIQSLFADQKSGASSMAAMIVEPVQGEGGVNPAPDSWLREIRRLTHQHGVPLIFDEVQTGLGRTGRLYAFQHAGVTPDVLVLSKAIGGGLPLAVVLYRRDLDIWAPGAHAGTFRGAQLSFASGAAAIRFVREQGLAEHADAMGARLRASLEEAVSSSGLPAEVRGRGLMLGVAISQDSDTRLANGELARLVQRECLDRGLIVELGGRRSAVIRFLPPLIISANEVDAVSDRFCRALHATMSAARATASA